MPLDKLIERILGDAEAHALSIIGEAQREGRRLVEEADAEAEERYRRLVDSASRAAGEEKKQQVTMASLEARKSVLEQKRALMAEAFDSALDSVLGLPPDEYVELMARLLAATGRREGQLIISPRDGESVGARIVSRANEMLAERGARGRITLSDETRDFAGGFILSSGGIEINNSLEALVNSQREELEPRIVEILFRGVD